MGKLDKFKIDLKGLKEENAGFEFRLDNDYFDAIDSEEVKGGELMATLRVRKVSDRFELDFHIEGMVIVACDICLDDMPLSVCTDKKMVVCLGDMFDDNDDMLTIPADEGVLDVAWLIYEFIALAVPMKHVHEEGACNPDMVKLVGQLSASSDEPDEDAIDPRWNELKKLKSTIKE